MESDNEKIKRYSKPKSFLGKGWSFPPSFHEDHAAVAMVEEGEDIRQSLFILLSTIPGERIVRPAYGCDLMSMVFERLNTNTKTQIVFMIEMAILHYEPRIKIESIDVTADTEDYGILYIHLNYTIIKTNARNNIVYPFYLKEGTLVKGK